MTDLEKIVALAKRRGFIYPGSEIYGGLTGTWDYGPLGVELKNNIKRAFWQSMVYERDDVVGIDSAILANPKVWEASGHVKAFTDPLVECKSCHARFKADRFPFDPKDKLFFEKWLDSYRAIHGIGDQKDPSKAAQAEGQSRLEGKTQCPSCFKFSEYTEPKKFNLLVEAKLGVVEDEKQKVYLRGEITQGVHVNFKNVLDSTRVQIPFGIAQIGKAFRNEITPGNFTFRSREFEQMELQYYVKPEKAESEKWYEYWKNERMKWYLDLGLDKKKLRFRQHEENERAHYAKDAWDIEYDSPFGWREFEGVHNRGDWDLSAHQKNSGVDMSYFDQESGKKFLPFTVETSGGIDRAALFFLIDAYHQAGNRTILKLSPKLAPYKVAVFPLLANKPELVKKARSVYQLLTTNYQLLPVAWDDRGNIGKRYFSQDEIGTPYCVTCDFQTLDDDTVTIRDRDSAKQERANLKNLGVFLQSKINPKS